MSSTAPKPRITVENLATSKEHEVFMSFGLLDQLVILVRDVQLIPELSFNADVRSRAIAACLAERDAQGRPLSADVNFDISVEDAHRLLDWMAEHLFDFFLKRLREHLKHVQSRASDLQAVGSLLTGSQTSVSSTPSSSP